jgi:hypothetical protein
MGGEGGGRREEGGGRSEILWDCCGRGEMVNGCL